MELNKIKQGDTLSNSELISTFKVSNTGGMRKNNKDNRLVLIADHTKSIYDDRWVGKIFHYTGMGLEGNQNLDYMQNKTLSESHTNTVEVHLLEVFDKNEYIYQGIVKLSGDPYTEQQPDKNGILRTVYIFPLELIRQQEQVAIPQEKIIKVKKIKEKIIHKYSDNELITKIKGLPSKAGTRRTISKQYDRNPLIVEFVKRKANGVCALCEDNAPFEDNHSQPFLEIHHIEWLSHGGEDGVENTVALCPNCHRKMHILNLEEDKEKLLLKAKSQNEL